MKDAYYNQIKDTLIENEIYKIVKDYSKNKHDLDTYFNVGKLLIEAQGGEERAKYGNKLIKEYSKRLIKEVDKKCSERNLMYMRKYFMLFKTEKLNAVRSKLSWSHYRELLVLKNINEINYYIDIAVKQCLSYRELGRRIKSKGYIDKNLKTINQDNTIGIIICKKNNHYVIDYYSDERILSREYITN